MSNWHGATRVLSGSFWGASPQRQLPRRLLLDISQGGGRKLRHQLAR